MSKRAKGGMPWWFYAIFIGMGLVFIAIGIVATIGSRRFLAIAAEAEGRIVDYSENRDINDDRTMYRAVVEFTVDGETRRFSANTSSSVKPRLGRRVNVLYNPDNPDNARIKSWSALWMLPTIFLAMGGVFLLLGAAMWYIVARQAARRRRSSRR